MCTAVERLGVDAAIVFSDLLPILEPMGMELEFAHGEGPLIHNPVRESADVDRVVELESADALHFVMEAVRQTRADLPAHIPLIGFAGAPFTLASYAIEGGASRNYLHTKTLMYRDAAAWNELMGRLSRAVDRVSQRANRRRRRRPCSCSTVGSAALGRTTIASSCCRSCGRSSTASRRACR